MSGGDEGHFVEVFLQGGRVKKKMVNCDRDYCHCEAKICFNLENSTHGQKGLLSRRSHAVEGPVELAASLDFVACG